MSTPIITLRMLRGACIEQKALFKREWPDGAPATLENVLRAVELGLDLSWGAGHWFTSEALAEYARQRATILAEYESQHAPIWAECQRQRATLRAEYKRQLAPIWLAALLASMGAAS